MNQSEHEVKLRLTLDVTYADPEGQDDQEGIESLGSELLEDLVRTAMNRGLLTGDTHLVVEDHAARVDRVEEATSAGLSDAQILEWAKDEGLDLDPTSMSVGQRLQLVRLARRAQRFERDRCAQLCVVRIDELKLMMGELPAQDVRTARALLKNREAAIRGRMDTTTA